MANLSIIKILLLIVLAEATTNPETNSTSSFDEISCERLTKSPHCVKLGKKFYLINPDHKLNWFQADRFCRQQNARLALLENDEEMDAILEYISRKEFLDNGFRKYYLGASDLGSPGTFYELESGKPLRFARWGDRQPDKWQGNDENCLNLIWWYGDKYSMNDEVCTNVLSFICEFTSTNGSCQACHQRW